jgi:cellulose synthase/poly-beta-1,6-N-acetylglucosamine synthase-like glycosyltransferase
MEKVLNFQVKQRCVLQGSASIAVTREVLDQAGGFPADVLVGVDWDLDCRLDEIHCRKEFVADATVQTHRVADLREFWRNEVRWRRGLFRVLRRHGTSLFDVGRFRWYWVAVTYAALLLAVLVLAIARPMDAVWPAIVWGAVTLSIIGRRARVAAAAAGFSGDLAWLRYFWAPGILQLIALIATVVSLATLRRISPFFKGPRPVAQRAVS